MATKAPSTPSELAHHTARWAKTLAKVVITASGGGSTRWRIVAFDGPNGSESRGIVDLIAIRKNHLTDHAKLKRGDLFDLVLIQVKGGSAPDPTRDDIERLIEVKRHHRATDVLLASWKRGRAPTWRRLVRRSWVQIDPKDVFG